MTVCVQTLSHPLVTVIIPSYNRGWVLKEAIDSVLSQDYPHVELIVVNDGSTDNTAQILSLYGDKINVIHQENRGVSAARNTGVSHAAGDYIAFLDSDDIWLPRKISVQIDFFNQYPRVEICQTEEVWIRNGVRVNPKKKHKKPSGEIFLPSLKLCLVSPSAVMLQKSLFTRFGGFDEDLPACEDYDLWLRISCRQPIFLIDTPLIVKRGGHPDQLSKAPGLDKYRIIALQKILREPSLSSDERDAVRQVIKEKCTIYANGCLKRGRLAEYDDYLALADKIMISPE